MLVEAVLIGEAGGGVPREGDGRLVGIAQRCELLREGRLVLRAQRGLVDQLDRADAVGMLAHVVVGAAIDQDRDRSGAQRGADVAHGIALDQFGRGGVPAADGDRVDGAVRGVDPHPARIGVVIARQLVAVAEPGEERRELRRARGDRARARRGRGRHLQARDALGGAAGDVPAVGAVGGVGLRRERRALGEDWSRAPAIGAATIAGAPAAPPVPGSTPRAAGIRPQQRAWASRWARAARWLAAAWSVRRHRRADAGRGRAGCAAGRHGRTPRPPPGPPRSEPRSSRAGGGGNHGWRWSCALTAVRVHVRALPRPQNTVWYFSQPNHSLRASTILEARSSSLGLFSSSLA